MKKLKVRILTPAGVLFEGESFRVAVKGGQAPFVVLPGHAPIISSVEEGSIGLDEGRSVPTGPGVVRVKDDEVTICVAR